MVTVQVLMSPGCSHGRQTLEMVRDVLAGLKSDASVEAVTVPTMEDAVRLDFRGSPTVRVGGTDIDPSPPADVGLG